MSTATLSLPTESQIEARLVLLTAEAKVLRTILRSVRSMESDRRLVEAVAHIEATESEEGRRDDR